MNVNCPGCNQLYKLDETRIPETGQKMRCPKCSTSFRINREGLVEQNPANKKPEPLPSMPPVLGLGPGIGLSDPFGGVDSPAPRKTAPGGRVEEDFSDLDMDLPAPQKTAPAKSRTDDFSDLDMDLPAPQKTAPAKSRTDDFGDLDMDLPAPQKTAPAKSGMDDFGDLDMDLPAPQKAAPGKSRTDNFGDFEMDLPAPAGGFGSMNINGPASEPADPFGGMDLPTTVGDFAAPRNSRDPFGDMDLPAPVTGVTDLPSPAGFSDLPSPAGFSDLPSPAGFSDLPSPAGFSDLPSNSSDFAQSRTLIGAPRPDDWSLPASNSNDDNDPFGGVSLPSPAAAIGGAPTLLSPGGLPSRAPAPSFAPDPFADISLPSPADALFGGMASDTATKVGTALPSSRVSTAPAPAKENFRTQGAGSTTFGQIDFGGGSDENSDEFDAFPISEKKDEPARRPAPMPASETFDLADSPANQTQQSSDMFGVPFAGGAASDTVAGSLAERKVGGKFEGRRRFERQSRKTQIIMLGLLLVALLGGGSLYFTPHGIFGVNTLIALLPTANQDAKVDQFFKTAISAMDKDTVVDLNKSLKELLALKQELKKNEDVSIIGNFLYNWHQIRFGIDPEIEKTATGMLGNLSLETSESRYASIARNARALVALKPDQVISSLGGKSKLTPNESSVLVFALIATGNVEKALATVNANRDKDTPRGRYLMAMVQVLNHQRAPAQESLKDLVTQFPKHWDARLLLAETYVMDRVQQDSLITGLLNPIEAAPKNLTTAPQRGRVHALLGQMLLQRRQYPKARAEFEKTLDINSKDTIALLGLGRIANSEKRYADALSFYLRARGESPLSVDAQLGEILALFRQEKIEKARIQLLEVMPRAENNADAHYIKALIDASLGNAVSAEPSFKKAIELDSELIEAYVGLADLYMSLKRGADAMKTLDSASKAVPGSTLIKLTLATGHAANNDWSSAIVVLNDAVEFEPDNPEIHFMMAQMYRKMESYQDAQSAIDEVIRIDKTYPGVSVEQGLLMELSGNVDQALVAYEKALAANPTDNSAKVRVAAASIYKKKFVRAKELLIEVLSANPDSSEGNFYMGEIFRLENSPANAIPYMDAAVKNDPKNPLYLVRYGATFSMLHDIAKANQAFEKAKEMDPNLAEIYLRIGELLLRSGSARDSIAQFDKALEIDPRIESAYLLSGRAWEELANLSAAASYYKKAAEAFPLDAEGHYRLGLALLQIQGNKAGIGPLATSIRLSTIQEAGIANPAPSWLPDAYYEIGKAQKSVGEKAAATENLKRYLEIAPERALDRPEVEALLMELRLD